MAPRFNLTVLNLADVKANLERGQRRAFGAAIAVGIAHWKETYIRLHFQPVAFSRYGTPVAKYARTEANSSKAGRTMVGAGGRTLPPPYSVKNAVQLRAGWDVTKDPFVFSGETMERMTSDNFRIRGWQRVRKSVEGVWTGPGRIDYRKFSGRNARLLPYLYAMNSSESGSVERIIRDRFDANIKLHQAKAEIPVPKYGD